MQTQIIDGKAIAVGILEEVKLKIAKLNYKPVLVDLVAGFDPVTSQFVGVKKRTAEKVGFAFEVRRCESREDFLKQIEVLSGRLEVCGVIVQLPLPFLKDEALEILNAVPPTKDIDCLSDSVKKLFYETDKFLFVPPVAGAVVKILQQIDFSPVGKKCLVIGQGELAGRPTAEILRKQGFDVMTADIQTSADKLVAMLSSADLVVTAVGHANFLRGDRLKSGVVVIDAGTSESKGLIKGDADTDSLMGVAGFLTPVPGGVGPVVVACLLYNAVQNL